ncbi:hypothetical protein AB0L82_10615 [Nocardia sp. NPDC052001]|uniref:hypothetical protein n=1 Tax=Nocardia sp. NPDC052001 TaxID=3154853 RepID=UPI00342FCC09
MDNTSRGEVFRIEDASGIADRRIRDFGESVERVAAAAQTAKESPTPFTLTALSVDELGELGVRRISVGGGLARLGADWVSAATDIARHGTFAGLR